VAPHRIAVIPGDGIGKEVVPPAQRVLEEVGRQHGFSFAWTELDWSCERYARTGAMMPTDGIDQLREHDQVCLGAVGFPGVPDHVSLWGLLIPIRRAFRQYVNLRPVKLLRGMTSPLRGVEADRHARRAGEQRGRVLRDGRRFGRGRPASSPCQESVFTAVGVERVTRYALDLAESRSGRLASATKSNGIIHTMPFWDEVVREQVAARPGSSCRSTTSTPSRRCSSSTRALRRRRRVQPVRRHPHRHRRGGDGQHRHRARAPTSTPRGSSLDVRAGPRLRAGHRRQGRANPLGQVWSAAMMLDHLATREAAAQVVAAMETVLADTGVRTADLGGTATHRRGHRRAAAGARADRAAGPRRLEGVQAAGARSAAHW
jgi:tartrate dehydrogenase/decarboxylase/D-malate dehydrogenase